MEIIFKHAWVFFIIVTIVNAYSVKSNAKQYISQNPDLEEGYDKIFKGMIIIGNIPWIIIAIGILSGMTNSMFDFFRPRTMNPIVLLFHFFIILFCLISIWWIYFKDGAEFMERHPGLIQRRSFFSSNNMTAKEIKILLPLLLFGAIVGMIFMWIEIIP